MRIKFCGITNKEDADNAVNLGVDALGFIFHKDSPRYVTPEIVQEIVYFLPPFVTTVGVFVNLESEEVNHIMQTCRLDVAQLHGDESPEYCMKIKSRKIKAFRVSDQQDIKQIGRYQGIVSAALLDTKDEKQYGGTGKVFDWGLAPMHQPSNITISGFLFILFQYFFLKRSSIDLSNFGDLNFFKSIFFKLYKNFLSKLIS